jgi:hypothetical protein
MGKIGKKHGPAMLRPITDKVQPVRLDEIRRKKKPTDQLWAFLSVDGFGCRSAIIGKIR